MAFTQCPRALFGAALVLLMSSAQAQTNAMNSSARNANVALPLTAEPIIAPTRTAPTPMGGFVPTDANKEHALRTSRVRAVPNALATPSANALASPAVTVTAPLGNEPIVMTPESRESSGPPPRAALPTNPDAERALQSAPLMPAGRSIDFGGTPEPVFVTPLGVKP